MRRTANRQTNTQPDELLGLVEMLAEWAVEDYLREQQAQPQPKNQQRRAAAPSPKKANPK
jgi:hypothetical protein